LRPFELATFRLNNMYEIIQNWSDYILNEEYLPQRGASFLLNNKNQIIYNFFSNDVLGYSSNMRDPLGFLNELIKDIKNKNFFTYGIKSNANFLIKNIIQNKLYSKFDLSINLPNKKNLRKREKGVNMYK